MNWDQIEGTWKELAGGVHKHWGKIADDKVSSTCAGALCVLVALSLATPAFAVVTPADAWTTTKVKISLATTEGVNSTEVHVDTISQKVTLHGTVDSPAEKATAESTAKAVDGVVEVRNLLQVVRAKKEAAVEAKDDDISVRVSAALAENASIKGSSISVQSVNKGLVLLKGNARNLSELLTAVEITRSVSGVRRVASEVQTPDVLADATVWKERNIPVGGTPEPTYPGAAVDLYITSIVKMALLTNRDTPAMEINVDTSGGVVTLFGVVPTEASKVASEAEATNTAGVDSVRNQLEVVARTEQPAVEAKDGVIEENVKKNLAESPELSAVIPEVRNCVARLTGTVESGVRRVEAMQVARATSGVCSVKEDLTIQ